MDDTTVARLRAGAHEIPPATLDPAAILESARRGLRRRRRRQGATAVFVLLVGGILAGPIPVPGVGTVAMPGSTAIRRAVGLAPPTPGTEQMAAEVTDLEDTVLPTIQALRVTWVEDSECAILVYRRGAFSRTGTCAGLADERPFDTTAGNDLERVLDALRHADAPVHELSDASYTADGTLRTAVLQRSGGGTRWDDSYVYSPSARPDTPRTALGPGTVTQIEGSRWWFVRTPND